MIERLFILKKLLLVAVLLVPAAPAHSVVDCNAIGLMFQAFAVKRWNGVPREDLEARFQNPSQSHAMFRDVIDAVYTGPKLEPDKLGDMMRTRCYQLRDEQGDFR